MFKTVLILITTGILLLAAVGTDIAAQVLLDGPEGVVFDSVRNRYLATCYEGGRIVSIDSNGVQSYWGIPQNWYQGCHIEGNILYATGPEAVLAFDLETGDHLSSVYLQVGPGGYLDGLATDTSGNLYIVNPAMATISKTPILGGPVTVLVSSGLPVSPQEIVFDARHNRLLLCSYAPNAPLLAVDPETGALTTLVASTVGFCDGITMDPDGNVYMTSNVLNVVVMYDSEFAGPEVTIYSGLHGPTGLDYNWRDNILAIPEHDADQVVLLSMGDDDDDGILNYVDNCPSISNSDQTDADNDNVGNVCDNCPAIPNSDQSDEDEDLIGDACDQCAGFDDSVDQDSDGLADGCDNCPEVPNPGQEDTDGIPPGDACCCIGIRGNSNSDPQDATNIADVTYLVDYLFGIPLGSPPGCPFEGNANSDLEEKVNIADISFLVDYLFGIPPGPAPQSCPSI